MGEAATAPSGKPLPSRRLQQEDEEKRLRQKQEEDEWSSHENEEDEQHMGNNGDNGEDGAKHQHPPQRVGGYLGLLLPARDGSSNNNNNNNNKRPRNDDNIDLSQQHQPSPAVVSNVSFFSLPSAAAAVEPIAVSLPFLNPRRTKHCLQPPAKDGAAGSRY